LVVAQRATLGALKDRRRITDKFDVINTDLDEKDWIILALVQGNARISFADLGRRAGLSPPAAAERLRRLEDAGIILGYHTRLSTAGMGLGMLAIIEMRISRSEYQRFQKAIRGLAVLSTFLGRREFSRLGHSPSG
jgi:DNA-binding Lrp family transcriptional regulator